MSLAIRGIGTAVPECRIGQDDAALLALQFLGDGKVRHRSVASLYQRTGVRTRHSVLLAGSIDGNSTSQDFYASSVGVDDRGPSTAVRMQAYHENAITIAVPAARKAMADASIDSGDMTHLITVSCSGFSAPGVDIQLVRHLGLSRSIARTHVGFMGCHGALNAIRMAQAVVESQANSRVLVVAAELCSLHHQYGSYGPHLVSNALFADGSAAIVGEVANDNEKTWSFRTIDSLIIPDTEDMLRWTISDHGFQMELCPHLPDVLRQELKPCVESWLRTNDLTINQVGSWAIHPGGPKILQACSESLGLKDDQLHASHMILETYGNMSSPTVLFILERLRSEGAHLPCVVLGFGPGLSIEMGLVTEGRN